MLNSSLSSCDKCNFIQTFFVVKFIQRKLLIVNRYQNMLSFWEQQTLTEYDFIVVGAGIMGCSVAFELREKFPDAKIVVLERGIFSSGASTKNAGFMCFGSPTEILSDIKLLGETKAYDIIWQRVEGLKILTERLSNEKTGCTNFGGYELIKENPLPKSVVDGLNEWLMPIFKVPVFSDASQSIPKSGFQNVQQLLHCVLESQIDSGKMMLNYWKLLQEKNIQIITGANVKNIQGNTIEVNNNATGSFTLKAAQIILCTNAFINELLPDMPVKPGRGQVILTNEIENLPFQGSFHFEEGFYYFRNVGKRVLFGGGRNIDFQTEETTAFEPNSTIINDLKLKLKEIILPNIPFEIEQQWQGIMGFSDTKLPIVMSLNNHTKYIMSCNGMGIALSPFVAKVMVTDL